MRANKIIHQNKRPMNIYDCSIVKMLTRLFRAHGQMCASRPWEVIIGTITLTVSVMSMSFFTDSNQICGWNYKCEQLEDVKSSDLLILTITRCLAVMYFYLQFRKLRKIGSKYLFGVVGVFTIVSSFVFSTGVINLLGSDLTGLNEALPFFLLLVDLSKACALAKFARNSASQDEVVDNIGRGMAVLGPTLTLDALVEVLVIGVGTLSGVKQLETMCCFGCLSVVANYLAFMTFFPACLALVLELSRDHNSGRLLWQIPKALEEQEEKQNPVTQRVKIIMSVGLVIVHIRSRFFAEMTPDSIKSVYSDGNDFSLAHASLYMTPQMPLWRFYLQKLANPSIDYIAMFTLAAILTLKYIFFDGSIDQELEKELIEATKNENTKQQPIIDELLKEQSTPTHTASTWEKAELESQSQESTNQLRADSSLIVRSLSTDEFTAKSIFSIGDDDDNDDDDRESAKRILSSRRMSVDAEVQTDATMSVSVQVSTDLATLPEMTSPARSVQECLEILNSDIGPKGLRDDEVILLVNSKHIPSYKLEATLEKHERAVSIRRKMLESLLINVTAMENLPYANYDYAYVDGACCENVIGYMPVPVGVAGPLLLDGITFHVPMATTEGCLVASTNRGCRALTSSGGVTSVVIGDGMSRAPLVRFPSAFDASTAKRWLETPENYLLVSETFDSTSRFAHLKRIKVVLAARYLFIRFVATTGDAMGMNMISKGCEKVLNMLVKDHFPNMEIISLSGNFCTDKKPSAVNWIEGRGKSVVCEATVPSSIITSVLKTTVAALIDLNISKNLIGSAIAGSIGGFNAHAANSVAAIFIATGQDPAQVVCSSSCMTIMEAGGLSGQDLYISCTMPCIEVGTVGGGTVLPPQAACLQMLGLRGPSGATPGDNAARLARVVCATVMASELSLMSALAAGHLVRSHLRHNRSSINVSPADFRVGMMPETAQQQKRPGECIP